MEARGQRASSLTLAPQTRLKNGLLRGSFGLGRLGPGAPAPSSGASKNALSRGGLRQPPGLARCSWGPAHAAVRFHNFPVRARAVAPWLRRPVETHGGACCCCWPKGGARGRAGAGCGALQRAAKRRRSCGCGKALAASKIRAAKAPLGRAGRYRAPLIKKRL